MKRLVSRSAILVVAMALAGPASDGLGLRSVASWLTPPAAAIIGMPLTPLSAAGVARRTAYVAGATTAAVATVAVSQRSWPPLPAGCTSVQAGGSAYFNCGGVFYRPSYQSTNLVYVVVPAR